MNLGKLVKNKSGLELAVGTIVLIALGVIILIFLILMLTGQTSFFEGILNSFRGSTNVDAVIAGCNSLVSNEQFYSYCCEKKIIKTGKNSLELTCDEFRQNPLSSGRINELSCAAVSCLQS